jgi:hypothetical protein
MNRRIEIKDKKPLIISLVLALSFINPFTEEVMFSEEPVYMASHYALAFAGAILGYYYFSPFSRNFYSYIGSLLIVLWHLPTFFTLGGGDPLFRALDEISIITGGFLIGVGAHKMKLIEKILLLVLWMLGDTTLAVVLVISYPFYLPPPYPLSQEPITGYVMVIAMTGVLGFIVYKGFKSLNIFG